MKTVITFLFALSFSIASAQEWKQLKGPTKANIRQIEVGIDGSIYAMSDSNEIYLTEDLGKSWDRRSLPEKILPSQHTVLYCSRQGALYVGVSLYIGYGQTLPDSSTVGMYRSTNKGLSWQQVDTSEFFVSISEDKYHNLYALTDYYANSKTILYKSTNSGITWKPIQQFGYLCTKITIDDANRIYLQEYNRSKILIYDNNGDSLTEWFDKDLVEKNSGYNQYGTFKIIGTNKYAFLADSIFYDIVNDSTWVAKDTIHKGAFTQIGSQVLQYHDKLIVLGTSTNGPSEVSEFISTELGKNWYKAFSLKYTISNLSAIAIDSTGSLLYSDMFGLYRYNIESTEVETIGFPNSTTRSLVVDKNGDIHAADNMYISNNSSKGSGRMVVSSDQGNTWKEEYPLYQIIGNIGPSPDSGVYCIYDSTTYSANNKLQLHHYDPSLRTWNKVSTFDYYPYQTEFKFFSPSTLYMDLIYSDDEGISWEGLDDYPSVASNMYSFFIKSPGEVLIGYKPSIYMTVDNGTSWKKLKTGLVDRSVTALYANNDSLILAGTEYGDLLRSDNNGSTWYDWRGPWQGSIQKITSTVSDTLLVATSDGLYSRDLKDSVWKVEIQNKNILYVAFGIDNQIYASAEGQGIWTDGKKHFVKPKVGVKQKGIQGISVSPNPAVSTVTAGFDMNAIGRVTLSLVDELGREVLRKNELLGEGWHQVNINVSMIPSGFYHALLETPSGKTISKVVVSH